MIKVDGVTFLIWAIILVGFLAFWRGDLVVLRTGLLQRAPAWVLLILVFVMLLVATFILAIVVRLACRVLSR